MLYVRDCCLACYVVGYDDLKLYNCVKIYARTSEGIPDHLKFSG